MEFLNEDCLSKLLEEIIDLYFENLQPYDLDKFNANLVDPIKFAFEKIVYKRSDTEIIDNEILRQREKNIQNKIGRLHQDIFSCINNCTVPKKGWDVIYTNPNNGEKIYIELKNKHNTMNSKSSSKTYQEMKKQVNNDPNCKCYLVEVISKTSQSGSWDLNVKKGMCCNPRICKYSIDKFYEEITGLKDSFFNIVQKIIELTSNLVSKRINLVYNSDTVYAELEQLNQNIIKALFSIGFNYPDFDKIKI